MTPEEKKWIMLWKKILRKEGDERTIRSVPGYYALKIIAIIERQEGEIEELKNFCELQPVRYAFEKPNDQ